MARVFDQERSNRAGRVTDTGRTVVRRQCALAPSVVVHPHPPVVIPAERSESRDPLGRILGRMGPGSALRAVRDDRGEWDDSGECE
jgi:hypothetical protein